MFKLIACDLDGTLLDEPNSISKTNLEAIEYACEKGVKFCFATGRDLQSVRHLIDLMKYKPVLVLGNGSEVYDEHENKLFEDFFPNDYFSQVVRILHKYEIRHMVFASDGFYTTTDPVEVREKFIERIGIVKDKEHADIFANNPEKPCNNLVLIEDMNAFIKEKKILKVEGFDLDLDRIEAAKEELSKIEALSSLSTGPKNVEVTNRTAQKHEALLKYIEHEGIQKDEVMILGDSFNDLGLFESFPYSFAPENSVELIKDKAYKIVKSCNDHGVSDAIYKMIK